ncbi:uncharacterized protein UTRI_10545 [Ustilago trichophora]|uniref:Uncharacterized protein n=1 Tax=Ustilago trichophora TaxID=86804 RepID=A0A5C3EAH6_9BASI|nr:uncharacterized protein UTRI_10545 [Ustilago trichophora]
MRHTKGAVAGSYVRVWNDDTKLREYHGKLQLVEPELLEKLPRTMPPIEREAGYRIHFPLRESDEERRLINAQIFDGKLEWVDTTSLPRRALDNMKRFALTRNRVLPLKTPFEFEADGGGGVVRSVRMTAHGGLSNRIRSLHGTNLEAKTLFNFWGVPEGRKLDGRRIVYHFGTGFIEPENLDAVNKHLQQLQADFDHFPGKHVLGSIPK